MGNKHMKTLADEQEVLGIMKKDNFRGISKDDVMHLASVLDSVEPEVAGELIKQMPEVIGNVAESEKAYFEVMSQGIKSVECGTAACFESEDAIIKACIQNAEKADISFEEKKFYFEKMAEAAERKEAKDTENKRQVETLLELGGKVVFWGMVIAIGIFCGRADIKLPWTKSA